MVPEGSVQDLVQLDALLSAEERAVRDRVRAFAERYLRPLAADAWEREAFPAHLLPELGRLGIVGGSTGHPSCPRLTSTAYGLAAQEIARGDSSFSTFFGVHSGLAMGTIAACGSEVQQQRWLPRMARCEIIGAFALTEPGHGSDAAHLQTRAVWSGAHYVLDGCKRWIGNGDFADLVIVWARADDGIAGFVVEPPTPGFTATRIAGKLSKRGVWQAEIRLDGCRVPAENRLPRGGFRAVAEILSQTRHNVAWTAVGEAIACYEAALSHVQRRQQFGKPIGAFQLVQDRLVEMLTDIAHAHLLCLQLSRLKDAGLITAGMTAYAKLNNAAMAQRVARAARELLGGNGILNTHDVMRHLCDLESVVTYEGTAEINTLIVGREITGVSAFV